MRSVKKILDVLDYSRFTRLLELKPYYALVGINTKNSYSKKNTEKLVNVTFLGNFVNEFKS